MALFLFAIHIEICNNQCGSMQDGLSCLHYKATLESPDIVQLLIDKGAEVDNLADVRILCIKYTQLSSYITLLTSKGNTIDSTDTRLSLWTS